MRFLIYQFIAVMVLSGFSQASLADCWKVTDKDGLVTTASDIWHLRNRLTNQSAFLGTLDGNDTSVLTDEIRSFTTESAGRSRPGIFQKNRSKGKITFLNGRTANFESDVSLTVVTDSGRSEIPFEDIRSIVRCEPPAVTAKNRAAEILAPKGEIQAESGVRDDVHTVILTNGNILKGTVTTEVFHWQAPYASLKVDRRYIRQITLVHKRKNTGLLQSRSGDRISGDLQNKTITMRLTIGQTIVLDKDQIQSINFAKSK